MSDPSQDLTKYLQTILDGSSQKQAETQAPSFGMGNYGLGFGGAAAAAQHPIPLNQANAFNRSSEERQARMANPASLYAQRPQQPYHPPAAAVPAAAAQGQQPAALASLMAFMQQSSAQQASTSAAQPQTNYTMAQQSYGVPQTTYAGAAPPQRAPAMPGAYSAMNAQAGVQQQVLARLQEQQRAAQAQAVAGQQTSMSNFAQQPAIFGTQTSGATEPPVAGYLAMQSRLRGFTNRMTVIENALKNRTRVNPPNSGVASGQPADQATLELYARSFEQDKRNAAALQEAMKAYIHANGGIDVVKQQVQAFQEQKERVAIAQRQQAGPMQQMSAPSLQNAQQSIIGLPQRPPSTTPAPPAVVNRPLQKMPRPTPEQIASMFQREGLNPKAFDTAFAEMRTKGSLPPLTVKPIINGREISLYELIKVVLSKGGCDFIDAKNMWHHVAQALGVFRGNEDHITARDASQQVSDLYHRHVKNFEDIWTQTVMRRRQDSGPQIAPSAQEQMAILQGQQPRAPALVVQPQQGMSMNAMPSSRAPTPSTRPAAAMPAQPVPAAPVAAAAGLQPLPRLVRPPTEAEKSAANMQISQMDKQTESKIRSTPLPPRADLDERQKAEVRAICVEAQTLASNLKSLLPTYLCVVGQGQIANVGKYLEFIHRFQEQARRLEQNHYLLTPDQLRGLRDSFSTALQQLSQAMKQMPRPAPSRAESVVGQADRETVIAGIRPGIRREDLKPPPAKRARNTSTTEMPVAEVSSPGKAGATPEGTSPKTPGASASPATRGRQASARGNRGGRGRGSSVVRGRTTSVGSAGPSPMLASAPLPVDPAEQQRLDDEAAKANPTQYAIDAFMRYHTVQADRGFSFDGLTEDLGARNETIAPLSYSIAPIAANPPPMPTLSSLAPGWPAMDASVSARAAQSANDDDGNFDYSAFLNFDDDAGTPELNSSNGSPPDDAVVTPKSVSAQATASSKRKRDSSPQPVVPELGESWSWDSLLSNSNEPSWQALGF